jgi:hypothetical protein
MRRGGPPRVSSRAMASPRRIGPGRFLLGALAAGLVSNASGILLAHFVLGAEMQAFVERLGGLSPWTALVHVSMRLAMGAAALWVLLATEARLGRLVPSLLVASLVAWLLLYPVPLEFYALLGVFGPRSLAIAALWGFAELVLATAVGRGVCLAGRRDRRVA